MDYALTQPAGLTASINPASLTISGITALDKVYDATNTATLNTASAALNGIISGDTLTLGTASAAGSFATSDVGTGIAVTASGFTLSGAAASNYRMAQPTGLAADITPKSLSAAIISTPTKIYNGDAGGLIDSTGFSLTGFAGSESATISQSAHVAYATSNAGSQTVTATLAPSDFTAGSGTKLSNYLLPTSVTGTGVIDPAPITISLAGNPTKTYDATTAAVLSSSNFLLSGFLSGQSATVTQTAGTYDSPNAGVRQVTTTLGTGDFTAGSGTLLSNYSFPTSVTGFGTITPAPIAGGIYAGITGNPTKFYDGTTTATLSSSDFTLTGFLNGDGATVAQTTGQYATKNVGVQPVTANLTPGDFTANNGTNLSNYTLPNMAYGSGTINPAVLTASITGTPTKVYNGTTRATVTGSSFSISGLAPGEGIIIDPSIPAAYDAPQAGSRTVTASIPTTDISAQSGTLLSNYVLPTSATGSGLITQAPLSILGVAAQNKTYDTTTAAALSTGSASLFGLVGTDTVSLSTAGASGVFASPNAGSNVPVTASGFSISGSDAANYQLFQPTGLAATIFRAPLSITGVNALNKVYDNTNAASLNTGSAALSGVFSNDSGQVSLDQSGATASFASVNVGNNLAVSASGFALNGAQSANYSLSQPSGLSANITARPLTALIVGDPTKVYDGSTSTTLRAANYNLAGFVSGQGASVPQSAAAQYVSADAGSEGITSSLASSDFVANTGTNLSNYILPTSGSGTGTITPAPLTAAIIGNPTKTYDSTTAATLGSSNYALTGFISGQGATVTQTAGTYDIADAGSRSVTAALSSGDFTAAGATNLSNYALPSSATGPGTINKAPLQVVNVAGTDRAYNGGYNDALNVSSANVAGLFGSDSVTLNIGGAAGVFASKDAGTGIAVTASGFSISGGQSADYTLQQPTGLSANITQAILNLTNVTRVYDSTTSLPSTSSAYTLAGIFGSDSVAVDTSGLSGNYADKNVGTNKSVSVSGLALTGAQASDYSIASSLTNAGIGTITPASLTVAGAIAQNKVYDATSAATLDNSSATLSGLFAGDAVTLDATAANGVFNNKNVGNGKAVTASGYTVSGGDAGNYTFTQPSYLSANITPYSGISLDSITKTYDGGTNLPSASSAYVLGGLLALDSVQVATAGITGSYASSNVGQNLSVSLNGLALTGTDAANYSIGSSLSNASIGFINPKLLTASIVNTPTKTYDTTTAATLSASNFSVAGFVAGQGATVTQTSGVYSSANAGSPTVSSNLAAGDFTANGGTLLSNYTLPTSASGAGKINQAPLTITGVLATDKVYDRNTADALNNGAAALSGVFGSDTGSVTLNTAGATGTFATPNAGTGIAVTAAGFTIGGSKAANYTLSQPAGLSADISEAILSLASVSKVYDATTAAVGAGVSYTLSGIVGADSVSLNTAGLAGTYAAKNAGSSLSVSLSGLSLAGAQAANYSIAPSISNALIGTITKAPLTVAGAVAVNKVYSGTTAAAIDDSSAHLSGVLGSDVVNFASPTTGTFASSNAGTWAVMPGSSYLISGADAANYNLTQPTGFSASITPAPLSAAIIGNPTKTYDAGTAALLSAANYSLTGFVAGEGASVSQTSGVYDLADAGNRIVSASLVAANFTPNGGTSLSNYTLPTSASGAGLIDPKALSAAIVGTPAKTYDGGPAAVLSAGNYSLSGFIAGQGASVTQTAGMYSAPDAGTRTVTASLAAQDFSANGGTNLANYLLPTTASGAGLINPMALTAAITGLPTKTYDATSAATLDAGDYTLTGFVAGQSATVTQTAGTYDSADAGSRMVLAMLAAGDFSANGATNLSNYILPASASGSGVIDRKTLTAAITGNPTKTYDGNDGVVLTPANYSFSGFVAGQSASVLGPASYDSADAGSRTINAPLSPVYFNPVAGTNLNNYSLPMWASGPGTINPQTLTAAITGTPVKAYDGTNLATLAASDYTLSGFITGQGASVTQSGGTYAGQDAGTWAVFSALAPQNFAASSGTNLSNYVLPTAASGSGRIDPKALSAAIVNASKTYDGSTSGILDPANFMLTGFANGQGAIVNQTAGVYASPDAGSHTVTANLASGDFTLTGGANASNYILPTAASGTGLINPKLLTAAITGTPNKIYDGTAAASLSTNDYTLYGFIAGQGASITQTAGNYDSANAGSRTVNAVLGAQDFSALPGTNFSNYVLPTTAFGAGSIIAVR